MVAGSGELSIATRGSRGGAMRRLWWASSPPQAGGQGCPRVTWTVTVADASAGATPNMSAYAGASETLTVYVPTGRRTAGAELSSPTAHPRSIPQTEPSVNALVPQNCGYRGVSGPEPSTRWRFQSFGQKFIVRDAMTPREALETVKLTNLAIPSHPCATVAGSARRCPPMTSVTPIGLRYPGRATLSWKSPPIDAR